MKNSIQVLPGISRIGWLDCSKLTDNVALAGICGMPVPILTDVHNIDFCDAPSCERKSSKENGDYSDSVTLKFCSASKLDRRNQLAFVATDVNGVNWLIGSKEVPNAVISEKQSTGTANGDPAVFEYEVTHVAIRSMIPCICSNFIL